MFVMFLLLSHKRAWRASILHLHSILDSKNDCGSSSSVVLLPGDGVDFFCERERLWLLREAAQHLSGWSPRQPPQKRRWSTENPRFFHQTIKPYQDSQSTPQTSSHS